MKNSIRNCLTVFQRDPLFRGALRLNLLTEQIDIVKPLGWERTSTTLTDMDMNYLLLYLEENYGVQIDHDKYNVFYDGFASNIMPEITVILAEQEDAVK